MPQRSSPAVAIPHLRPGEWFDQASPGLILRVGKQAAALGNSAITPTAAITASRSAIIPAMGLSDARDAARTADRPRRARRAARGTGTASAVASALTLGGLFDHYEALRKQEGRKIKTLRRGDAAAPAEPRALPVAAGRPVQQGRSARRPRCHGRARRHVRGQPPAAAARAGAEMGRAGRPDPGQLHA